MFTGILIQVIHAFCLGICESKLKTLAKQLMFFTKHIIGKAEFRTCDSGKTAIISPVENNVSVLRYVSWACPDLNLEESIVNSRNIKMTRWRWWVKKQLLQSLVTSCTLSSQMVNNQLMPSTNSVWYTCAIQISQHLL